MNKYCLGVSYEDVLNYNLKTKQTKKKLFSKLKLYDTIHNGGRVKKIRISLFVDLPACRRPWSTMECSQQAAWTTNRNLLVASRVRPFQEDRSIPARPYPELRTWMVVRSGVISVFPTHSGNAPASPDIRPITRLCPACLPSTNSIPAHHSHDYHTHTPTVTNPIAFHAQL